MMLLTILLLFTTVVHYTLSTTPSHTTTNTHPHYHHSLITHHSLHSFINTTTPLYPQQNLTLFTATFLSKHSDTPPRHRPLNLAATITPGYPPYRGDSISAQQQKTAKIYLTAQSTSRNGISKRSITSEPNSGSHNTTVTSREEQLTPQERSNETERDGGEGRGRRRRRGRRRKGKASRRVDEQEQRKRGRRRIKDLSLWIDRNQVKMFSGYLMEIFVIHNGRVLPYILDPDFEKQLPVIPAQVENVNFTWCSGGKKYQYTFNHLHSETEELLQVPVLSLPTHGTVPRKPRVFSVDMRCTGNVSGIATFSIGLGIHTHTPQKEPLPGTPLRLKLRKECRQQGPDPECDHKCQNGGVCDESQQCQCPEGYMGQYCDTALCYPQCLNGGSCTAPGRCSCPPGFQGRHCEGGICQNKCKNGGKCVQKDRCQCRRGFFGNWCQYSQCFVACINGGKCRGVNKCRCPAGFAGDHCEVVLPRGETATRTPKRCRRRCRHGECHGAACHCHQGYTGRWCRRRVGRGSGRQRVWVR